MRTTLKRGVGRGAGANGHSILPPAPLSPMTRYRQPPPPRRGRWAVVGRIVLWLVTVCAMLALGLIGGFYLWLHESVAAVAPHTKDAKAAQKFLASAESPKHAAIALVLGYDHRAGEGDAPSRSDTIMLLRTDPQTKSISMLSFPRDLNAEIYCRGQPVVRTKINAAYATCGSKGTVETVQKLTGLPINYLITVNFRGFKEVVNKLGGVWVDVDRRYLNTHGGSCSYCYATINLQPGYQRLTGGAALDFVRYRHTDSDLYRVARQQLFVQAMKQQLSSNFSFFTALKLVGVVTRNVEIVPGGGGQLSVSTVKSYAFFLYHLPGGHFFQTRINGLTGQADLFADQSDIQAAVQEFLNPDVQAPKVATAVALGHKPPRSATPKPADTTVVTLNGNGVPASAATAAAQLRTDGYRILSPPPSATGNAPRYPNGYNRTELYYDARVGGAHAAANALAKLFAPALVKPMDPPIRFLANGAMVVVVVGQTFHGTVATPPPDRTPVRQAPRVVANAAATESVLASVRSKVPFRLQVPTVLEQTSRLDSEQPVRAYTIAKGHKAVRLTFRLDTGLNEYWGIEQTTWEDAPILSSRSFRRVLGGRTFDLYYSGSHLHMVVLHEGGASYWVVNTLLDSLSNETMLAIARGLRPLGAR
jgi:LCP family protein required for cell wall assembly